MPALSIFFDRRAALLCCALAIVPTGPALAQQDDGFDFDALFGENDDGRSSAQQSADSSPDEDANAAADGKTTAPRESAATQHQSKPAPPAEPVLERAATPAPTTPSEPAAPARETIPVSDEASPASEMQVAPPPPPKPSRRIDEIVVTAQKREQSLQDVPMSITAVTGEKLEALGAESFTDYADTVPSLNFNSRGEGQQRINLRGLQGIIGVPTVAWLVDGVEQAISASSSDPELFDIARIEILRGPQGTLYGAGAVGGAISIVSNLPDPSQFHSAFLGGIEVNDAHAIGTKTNIMVNVPLVQDKLGLRMVAFNRQVEGWIDLREKEEPPLYSSQDLVRRNANTVDVFGGRAAMTWFASDNLELNFRLWTQDSELGTGPAVSPSLEQEFGKHQFGQGSSPINANFVNNLYDQVSFDVDWDLGFMTMEALSGYAHVVQDLEITLFLRPSNLVPAQFQGNLAPALTATGVDPGTIIHAPLINEYDVLNQEFRFVSNSTGPLHWTAGIFYKGEDRYAFLDVLTTDARESIGTTELFSWSDQYAMYGQVEYAFNSKWTGLIGLRAFYEELRWLVTDVLDESPDFFDVSPKISLVHHWNDDILIYSTVAKGFRSGGINVPESEPPPQGFVPDYDPDVLWSYEIGANTTLFDGRIVFNAAIFHADWLNLQQELLLQEANGSTQRLIVNAGQAHSTGAEWEITALLSERLIGTLGGAVLDSKLDEDLPNPNIPGEDIAAGTWLENVPRFSTSASLTYALPIARDLMASATLGASYRTRSHGDILNSEDTWTKEHAEVDLRFALAPGHGRWDMTTYVNNLLNSEKPTYAFNVQDAIFLQIPRTIGFRFGYRF